MRQAIIAMVLTVGLTSLYSHAAEERDLAGTYAVKGVGVDGKAYEAAATISKVGETYVIDWKFADGGFHGVGLRDGESISFGWSNKEKAGLVTYHIHGNRLDGHWTDGTDNGKLFTETLTRQE